MRPRFGVVLSAVLAVPRAATTEAPSSDALDAPRCDAPERPHALPPWPRPGPRATGHLHLRSPCGEARLDLWNGGPTRVMVQLVWRGADERGSFVRMSTPTPLRVRAMTADGQFVPGSVHAVRSLTRDAAWIARCVPSGVCETLVAGANGPVVSASSP